MQAPNPFLPLIRSEIDLINLQTQAYRGQISQQDFQVARAAYNQNISNFYPNEATAQDGLAHANTALQKIAFQKNVQQRTHDLQVDMLQEAEQRDQDDALLANNPIPQVGIFNVSTQAVAPVNNNKQAILAARLEIEKCNAEITNLNEQERCFLFRVGALQPYIAYLQQQALAQTPIVGIKPPH